MTSEIEQLKAENAALKQELEELKSQMIRLVSHNLDLAERLEENIELYRRVEVAKEIFKGNIERQRNADLKDDGQLLAMIEIQLEENMPYLSPDFDAAALANLLGVSRERLSALFRHTTIHRTPEAYIDNLRTINAMRLLRERPNYNIAYIAEESGFNHVRTLQRRLMDVVGMTPADYRALFTRDL